MSVKDYKIEQKIEDVNDIIGDIRRIKKRLETVEMNLVDLINDEEREKLRKM